MKYWRCLLMIVFELLVAFPMAKAQHLSLNRDSIFYFKNEVNVDSTFKKRRFLRASGGILLVQVVPWSFSYFITKRDFSRISFSSIKNNLKLKSWSWDDDQFITNQFAHPYHGSLYFNSFRSNRYTFLQSSFAAVAGSLVWEIVGEKQNPSPNDLVNTSFGGIVLGEMTHRLTNKLLNNGSYGFRRQVNEVVGLLINPMNGLNRIVDGEWGKVRGGVQMDSSKIDAQFDLGLRYIQVDQNTTVRGENVWYGRMRFQYHNGELGIKRPFDEFKVDVEVGLDDSAFVNNLSVYGLLYGKELMLKDRVRHVMILSAQYDLFNNASFFYGGQSVNLNLASEFKIASKSKINTVIGMGPILLAAVPDQYLHFGQFRNYDYGSGLSLAGSGNVQVNNRMKFGLDYVGGLFYTISGNHSNYSLHAVSAELSLLIVKGFSANISTGYFTVNGNYRDYQDVRKYYSFGRASIGYQMSF